MMRNMIAIALFMVMQACSASDSWERVMIRGSAEANDPVLKQVRELEKTGQVKDVTVLESFPVQIWLTASKDTIEALQKIPRKTATDQ
ncbi:hypothetical protein L4174_020855 [Photobacterium sp. CCB-ST2H9]|uniref:hypothetical protein n=1 Tax=Photobacterium sp. CCB-ST2H9 TaxID=2912855 RepID=UPI002004C2A8|nr:hypothetical protein [Photobacterium sp. CCB-ST2H9]UTM59162.1 hypothetical protein L4174_020855 [Photobacterium sp. CCB-ST2H9]